jgi:hypothetical protein
MVLRSALAVNYVLGLVLQMQFTLKVQKTPMTNGIHRVSGMARFIKLIIYVASSVAYALKHAQLVRSR